MPFNIIPKQNEIEHLPKVFDEIKDAIHHIFDNSCVHTPISLDETYPKKIKIHRQLEDKFDLSQLSRLISKSILCDWEWVQRENWCP